MAQISLVKYSQLNEYFGRFDAEFFKPESLSADNSIKSIDNQKLGNLVSDGYRVVYENTKILHRNKVDEVSDARFLQATNINSDGLWIEVEDIGFVRSNDWDRYPKGRIKQGELLIEVKGQAEKVTIVQDYIPERTLVTGTLFKLSLRPNTISHEYLFAFFSSRYGKILRDRTKVNTLIAYVSKPELYKIPIPIPQKDLHDNVTLHIKNSFKQKRISKLKFQEAENKLNSIIGIDKLKFSNTKTFTSGFSEIVNRKRSDADFYQPKYRQLEKFINSIETIPLYSICSIQKGYEVGSSLYKDSGSKFIRVSNITKEGFSFGNNDKYISNETYNSLLQHKPYIGDILLTKDGTIGTSYVVDQEIEGILSSGIAKLKVNDSSIPKEYIALAINSKICQMQAQRDCSGALILHWKPEHIRNLKIPKLHDNDMNAISNLVLEAKKAKFESLNLLESAKQTIENFIDEFSN